jgi:hypothetical protein
VTAPIEIHREIEAVYGSNVMTVQHVRKWCREFSGCHVSVTDEQTTLHTPQTYNEHTPQTYNEHTPQTYNEHTPQTKTLSDPTSNLV